MARLRVSAPARADLTGILETSLDRWGEAGRRRYAALLAAALRSIANDPEGPRTKNRSRLLRGLRSLHLRLVRAGHGVKLPVHVVYFRIRPEHVEILRVLHERMDPGHHQLTIKKT